MFNARCGWIKPVAPPTPATGARTRRYRPHTVISGKVGRVEAAPRHGPAWCEQWRLTRLNRSRPYLAPAARPPRAEMGAATAEVPSNAPGRATARGGKGTEGRARAWRGGAGRRRTGGPRRDSRSAEGLSRPSQCRGARGREAEGAGPRAPQRARRDLAGTEAAHLSVAAACGCGDPRPCDERLRCREGAGRERESSPAGLLAGVS